MAFLWKNNDNRLCAGSGKSTLAKQLHQLTGLELIHLDQVFFKSGWLKLEKEKWVERN